MLNICVKIHEISKTVLMLQSGHEYVVEMAIFNVQKGKISKSMQSRVTDFALGMLSYGA